jgi:hypothetical protein
MPARKTTAIIQLKVRMREDLRRRLEREADRRKDSINNEVVRRLEGSFKRDADQDLASELRAENARLLQLLEKAVERLERNNVLIERLADLAGFTEPLAKAAMGVLPGFTEPVQEDPERGPQQSRGGGVEEHTPGSQDEPANRQKGETE